MGTGRPQTIRTCSHFLFIFVTGCSRQKWLTLEIFFHPWHKLSTLHQPSAMLNWNTQIEKLYLTFALIYKTAQNFEQTNTLFPSIQWHIRSPAALRQCEEAWSSVNTDCKLPCMSSLFFCIQMYLLCQTTFRLFTAYKNLKILDPGQPLVGWA